MKCTNCGKEIANESQFCEYCGAKVQQGSKEGKIYIGWLLIISMLFLSLMNFAFMHIHQETDAWYFRNQLIVLQCVVLLIGLTMYFLKKIHLPLIILVCIQFIIGLILCWDASENDSKGLRGTTYASLVSGPIGNSSKTGIFLMISPTTEEQNNYADMYSHSEAVTKLEEFARNISSSNSQYRIHGAFWKTSQTYYFWEHTYIYAWADVVLVLLYIIYAFIACKKGWKF